MYALCVSLMTYEKEAEQNEERERVERRGKTYLLVIIFKSSKPDVFLIFFLSPFELLIPFI